MAHQPPQQYQYIHHHHHHHYTEDRSQNGGEGRHLGSMSNQQGDGMKVLKQPLHQQFPFQGIQQHIHQPIFFGSDSFNTHNIQGLERFKKMMNGLLSSDLEKAPGDGCVDVAKDCRSKSSGFAGELEDSQEGGHSSLMGRKRKIEVDALSYGVDKSTTFPEYVNNLLPTDTPSNGPKRIVSTNTELTPKNEDQGINLLLLASEFPPYEGVMRKHPNPNALSSQTKPKINLGPMPKKSVPNQASAGNFYIQSLPPFGSRFPSTVSSLPFYSSNLNCSSFVDGRAYHGISSTKKNSSIKNDLNNNSADSKHQTMKTDGKKSRESASIVSSSAVSGHVNADSEAIRTKGEMNYTKTSYMSNSNKRKTTSSGLVRLIVARMKEAKIQNLISYRNTTTKPTQLKLEGSVKDPTDPPSTKIIPEESLVPCSLNSARLPLSAKVQGGKHLISVQYFLQLLLVSGEQRRSDFKAILSTHGSLESHSLAFFCQKVKDDCKASDEEIPIISSYVIGIKQMMAVARAFRRSLVNILHPISAQDATFSVDVDGENALFSGSSNEVALKFLWKSSGMIGSKHSTNLFLHGIARCHFNESNQILKCIISFDSAMLIDSACFLKNLLPKTETEVAKFAHRLNQSHGLKKEKGEKIVSPHQSSAAAGVSHLPTMTATNDVNSMHYHSSKDEFKGSSSADFITASAFGLHNPNQHGPPKKKWRQETLSQSETFLLDMNPVQIHREVSVPLKEDLSLNKEKKKKVGVKSSVKGNEDNGSHDFASYFPAFGRVVKVSTGRSNKDIIRTCYIRPMRLPHGVGAYYKLKSYVAELIEEVIVKNNGFKPYWISIKHNAKELEIRTFLYKFDSMIQKALNVDV